MEKILIIIGFTLILYFNTLKNSVILDDIPWYAHRQKKDIPFKGFKGLVLWFQDTFYGGATFGMNIELDHLFAIGLNCLTGVLIYKALGNNDISFWASILWLANPVNNQVTCWLNGRRFMVNIILTLIMMLSPWFIFLYPLTSVLQVSAFFAPILLASKSPLFLLIIPLVLGCCLTVLRTKIQARFKLVHDKDRQTLHPKRLFIIVQDYGHFFFKMLVPGTCAFTYPMHYYWGITEKGNKQAYSFNFDFWRGILAISLSVLGFYYFGGNKACLWAFLCLSTLQWCSLIPVTQDLADRYVSLPSVFMMFFVSYVAHQVLGSQATIFLAGLTVYYICMLFNVMRLYHNMVSYWEHARYYFPQIPAPRKYEIGHYLKTDVNKAWVLCKEGLQYNNQEFVYLEQAAVCHKIIGDLPAAKVFAEEAMKNYYINQEHIFAPRFQAFLKSLEPQSGTVIGEKSRQVKRQEERLLEKNKK